MSGFTFGNCSKEKSDNLLFAPSSASINAHGHVKDFKNVQFVSDADDTKGKGFSVFSNNDVDGSKAKNIPKFEKVTGAEDSGRNPFFAGLSMINNPVSINPGTQVTSSTGKLDCLLGKTVESSREVKGIFLDDSVNKVTSASNPFFDNTGSKNNIFNVGDKLSFKEPLQNLYKEDASSNSTITTSKDCSFKHPKTSLFSHSEISSDFSSGNPSSAPKSREFGNFSSVKPPLDKRNLKIRDKNEYFSGKLHTDSASLDNVKPSLFIFAENIKSAICLDSQSKYDVLDKIEKEIRKDVKTNLQAKDGKGFRALKGTCADMCPEKERYFRDIKNQVSPFELAVVQDIVANTEGDYPQLDHCKAVKEYSRSSADQEEPLPHQLRTVSVLEYTMDYLIRNIMDVKYSKRTDWFDFLWNRTRAIRKDITQQNLNCARTISIIEKCTRFHIFCSHYLCEHELHVFEPKMNLENLIKCQQTLKHMYEDRWKYNEECCPNESEFRCYQILLNLNDGDILREVMNFRKDIRESKHVRFALKAFAAVQENNYVRFFKLLRSTSFLNACLLQSYFVQVRDSALRIIVRTFSHSNADVTYPLLTLQNILAFDTKEDTSDFCVQHGLSVRDSCVYFNRSSFSNLEEVFQLKKSALISDKLEFGMSEIVNNGPLISDLGAYKPTDSFSENGFYVGSYHLLDDAFNESVVEEANVSSISANKDYKYQDVISGDPKGKDFSQNNEEEIEYTYKEDFRRTDSEDEEIPNKRNGSCLAHGDDPDYGPSEDDDEEEDDDKYNDHYDFATEDQVMFLREDFIGYLNELIEDIIPKFIVDLFDDVSVEVKDELFQSEAMMNQELAIICIEEARVAVSEVIKEEQLEKVKILEKERQIIDEEIFEFGHNLVDDYSLSLLKLICAEVYEAEVEQVETEVADNEMEKLAKDTICSVLNFEISQIAEDVIAEEMLSRTELLESNEKLFAKKKLKSIFHQWVKIYKQQQLIKSSLRDFPPLPPLLDPKELLHKLHPVGTISYALPKTSDRQEKSVCYIIDQKEDDKFSESTSFNPIENELEEGSMLMPMSSIIEHVMSVLFFKDFYKHCLQSESLLLSKPSPNDIVLFYNSVLQGIHDVLKKDTRNEKSEKLIDLIATLKLPVLPELDITDWNSSMLACKDFILKVTDDNGSVLLCHVKRLLQRFLSQDVSISDTIFPWSEVLDLCISNKLSSMYLIDSFKNELIFSTPVCGNLDSFIYDKQEDNPLKIYKKLNAKESFILQNDVSYMHYKKRNRFSREYQLRESLDNVSCHLNQLEASLISRKLKISSKFESSSHLQNLLDQSASFLEDIDNEKERRKNQSLQCFDTTVLIGDISNSTEPFVDDKDKHPGSKRTFEDSMIDCLKGIEDYRNKLKTSEDYWRKILDQ